MASSNSAFNWRADRSPTIFAKDPAFRPTKAGVSQSEVSSAAGTKRTHDHMAKTGVSLGYIPGLTRSERIALTPKAYARRSGVK